MSSCVVLSKWSEEKWRVSQSPEKFDDMTLKSRQQQELHSGHFMVSNLHDSESETEETENVLPQDGESRDSGRHSASDPHRPKEKNVAEFDELQTLFKYMEIAYTGKITSPKWNQFRGMGLALKNKIRLNNIIWREYHMQFLKSKKPVLIHFQDPLSEIHAKAEAIILEGKYWKRSLKTVSAEYARWRKFGKDVLRCQRIGDYSTIKTNNELGFPDFLSSLYSDDTVDATFNTLVNDIMMDLDDMLNCPTPKDLAVYGLGDVIQPRLLELQPDRPTTKDPLVQTSRFRNEPIKRGSTASLSDVPLNQYTKVRCTTDHGSHILPFMTEGVPINPDFVKNEGTSAYAHVLDYSKEPIGPPLNPGDDLAAYESVSSKKMHKSESLAAVNQSEIIQTYHGPMSNEFTPTQYNQSAQTSSVSARRMVCPKRHRSTQPFKQPNLPKTSHVTEKSTKNIIQTSVIETPRMKCVERTTQSNNSLHGETPLAYTSSRPQQQFDTCERSGCVAPLLCHALKTAPTSTLRREKLDLIQPHTCACLPDPTQVSLNTTRSLITNSIRRSLDPGFAPVENTFVPKLSQPAKINTIPGNSVVDPDPVVRVHIEHPSPPPHPVVHCVAPIHTTAPHHDFNHPTLPLQLPHKPPVTFDAQIPNDSFRISILQHPDPPILTRFPSPPLAAVGHHSAGINTRPSAVALQRPNRYLDLSDTSQQQQYYVADDSYINHPTVVSTTKSTTLLASRGRSNSASNLFSLPHQADNTFADTFTSVTPTFASFDITTVSADSSSRLSCYKCSTPPPLAAAHSPPPLIFVDPERLMVSPQITTTSSEEKRRQSTQTGFQLLRNQIQYCMNNLLTCSTKREDLPQHLPTLSTFSWPHQMFANDDTPHTYHQLSRRSSLPTHSMDYMHDQGQPSLGHEGPTTTRPSKAATLRHCADIIIRLRELNQSLDARHKVLMDEINLLEVENSNIWSTLSRSETPILNAQPSERKLSAHLRDWFLQYVHSKTTESWKFYIFGLVLKDLFQSYYATVSTTSTDHFVRSVYIWLQQNCSLTHLRPIVSAALCKLALTTSVFDDPGKLPDQSRQAAAEEALNSSFINQPTFISSSSTSSFHLID